MRSDVVTPAPPARTEPASSSAGPAADERLRRYMQAYWLRPENALWMTLRSLALSRVPFSRPSMDVSCGDGVFSFLHFGGQFDPAFDVFRSVKLAGGDSDSRPDMFDHVDESYQPTILAPPEDGIDVGTDCKANLLSRAQRLRFYGRLVEHDNNMALPLESAGFATVYCNSAYWVENIDGFLAELARITKPDGRVVLHVKLDTMKEFALGRLKPNLESDFLQIIGSRFESWPTLAGVSAWESRFQRTGFRIMEATPFVTGIHARLWDVGLRPIAPLLIRMADAIPISNRASIKADWVDLFCRLARPFLDTDRRWGRSNGQPVEMQYVLAPC